MDKYEGALFRDKQIGFFIYLGVEALMFATLFVTYIIFTPDNYGPKPEQLFETKSVVLSSVFLLTSSFTLIIAEQGLKKQTNKILLIGLGLTLALATVFLILEVKEFSGYLTDGYGMGANNFMASFYVLVGLHAAHVLFGICWMIVLFVQSRLKIPSKLFEEKLKTFSYYWHFVDLVWVFIILLVYLPYL